MGVQESTARVLDFTEAPEAVMPTCPSIPRSRHLLIQEGREVYCLDLLRTAKNLIRFSQGIPIKEVLPLLSEADSARIIARAYEIKRRHYLALGIQVYGGTKSIYGPYRVTHLRSDFQKTPQRDI